MVKAKNTKQPVGPEEITEVLSVTMGQMTACILGTTCLVHNRMSEKAKHELVLPAGKKTAIQRATTLKHMPVDEFRASPYVVADPAAPTLIAIQGQSFKRALESAALDMPNVRKAQVERLVMVPADLIHVYGLPLLKMDVVRMADMNRTPDIRTRAAMREWACQLTIKFVRPLVNPQAIANLLAAAGLLAGIGEHRPQKGGSWGTFRVCDKDDQEFKRIIKTCGRAAQVAAMAHPVPYDDESADLLTWFDEERTRRELAGVMGRTTTPLDATATTVVS